MASPTLAYGVSIFTFIVTVEVSHQEGGAISCCRSPHPVPLPDPADELSEEGPRGGSSAYHSLIVGPPRLEFTSILSLVFSKPSLTDHLFFSVSRQALGPDAVFCTRATQYGMQTVFLPIHERIVVAWRTDGTQATSRRRPCLYEETLKPSRPSSNLPHKRTRRHMAHQVGTNNSQRARPGHGTLGERAVVVAQVPSSPPLALGGRFVQLPSPGARLAQV